MSKISIEGNASGTGTLTIAAPNTNSNFTLTLPIETGTLVTTGITSGLNASALTTGTVNSDRLPTVPVSKGGTGATTLTANNVLLGNGTSAVQFVAPGTNGNVLTSNGTTWTSAAAGGGFPAGTVMLFAQTAAPTGWTKDTSNNNNSALRVVTGTASTGGSVDFTTAFASQTPTGTVSINTSGLSAGATTLSTSQIPSHTHTGGEVQEFNGGLNGGSNRGIGGNTGATGGGGSHSHSISGSATGSFSGSAINLAVKYVDVIRASKD